MKEKKVKNIQSIYIPSEKQEVVEKIDIIRWREHKSMSDIILEAMIEYVQRHQDGNNQMRLDSPDLHAVPQFFSHIENIRIHLSKRLDNEKDEYKFKIQEWAGVYEERYGEKPL